MTEKNRSIIESIEQSTKQSTKQNINEITGWRFQIDQDDIGINEGWHMPDYDRSGWKPVNVPGAWNFYDRSLWGYEGIGWYSAVIPAEFIDPKLWHRIRFQSVSGYTQVWLNGHLIAENTGRYLPFEADASHYLRHDGDNILAVRTDNVPRREWLPGTTIIEWVQYGGILQPVTLISISPCYVSDIKVKAVPNDANGDSGHITCNIEITNRSSMTFTGQLNLSILSDCTCSGGTRCSMSGSLQSSMSGCISNNISSGLSNSISGSIPCSIQVDCPPDSKTVNQIELDVTGIKRWDLDNPVLYTAEAALFENDNKVHSTNTRFAFRTIKVEGTKILLNDKPLYIKGVARYDEYESYGVTVPEDVIREDLKTIKASGANLIRVHYPQDPAHMKIADELGLLYMVEIPLCWWDPVVEEKELHDKIVDAAEDVLRRMIRLYQNHPSVIIWSMSNESLVNTEYGVAAMNRLIRVARGLDDTRLVTFVVNHDLYPDELKNCDIVAYNPYFGLFMGQTAHHIADMEELVYEPTRKCLQGLADLYPDKPVIASEFGTLGLSGITGESRFAEEYQSIYLEKVWRAIKSVPHAQGGIIWCWADYYHRRDFIGWGGHLHSVFGPYGVVTVDRKPKLALQSVKKMYTED